MSHIRYKLHGLPPRMLLFCIFFNQEWKSFLVLRHLIGCEVSFLEMSHAPGTGEKS